LPNLVVLIFMLMLVVGAGCAPEKGSRAEVETTNQVQQSTTFSEQDKAKLYAEVKTVRASSLSDDEKKAKTKALFNEAFEKVKGK